MKEFDPIALSKDQITIFNQREIEKHKKLFTSQQLYNGHKMWEVNCSTGEINEAKYINERVEFVDIYDLTEAVIASAKGRKLTPIGKKEVAKKDIQCNENCLYVGALNIKSVKKKLLKHFMVNAKISPK